MEPEDVHFRSAEHLLGEEDNDKATSERKEDGEESRKSGRTPVSRIPTFQSSLARKRVTVQTAESSTSPKTDGSSQQGQKEKAGSVEAGKAKISVYGGRETALPIPSAHLHTSCDISDNTSSTLAPRSDHSLDQTSEITKDSDQVEMPLQRPPLKNIHETSVTSNLVVEPVNEFETVSGETPSEDEPISAQVAAVDQLSSCSSVEFSDQVCEDTVVEDFEKGSVKETVYPSQMVEENCVTENDVKQCSVLDKADGWTHRGQDKTAKMHKSSDRKDSVKCLEETGQKSKTADTTHTTHSKTRMCTPSKQGKGGSLALFFLLPSILLLLGGFGLHIWQYGIPKSVSHLMSQLELHWLESLWLPQETCTTDCRFTLVESIPEGLPSGSPHLPSISEAWTNLLNGANSSVHIAAFYFTLRDSDLGLTEPSSVLGKKVFNKLKQLEPKGVKLKIAVNAPQPYIEDTDELVATGAEVREVDLQSITGGILHTKLWVVDKKHMYVGSANMDWRSLTQVKEVGVSVEDCSCLAQDASRIFDIYWETGSQKNGSLPPFWPGRFSALSSSKYPLAVKFNGVPARVYLSSSPPPLSSYGRSDDLSSILSVIADAEQFIYVSVMDYLPMSQFTEPIRFWPAIDSALREAACARGVEVKLLVSCWNHSPGAMFVFLQSLSVLNKPPLSCNIHIKVFEVPSTQEQKTIPFARVNHAKYMVTDRVVYIGTSNWSDNYFTQTAGVGLVVNQTGSAVGWGQQTIQSQLRNIFHRDWDSEYAQTLTDDHAEHCSGKKLT